MREETTETVIKIRDYFDDLSTEAESVGAHGYMCGIVRACNEFLHRGADGDYGDVYRFLVDEREFMEGFTVALTGLIQAYGSHTDGV